MENSTNIDPKLPIGPFEKQEVYSDAELNDLVNNIREAPEKYREILKKLTPADLQKTYRPGSWNVQQLVHHVADIQLLHLFRMKKALTEPDYTTVTLINMDAWAATADGLAAPIEDSLMMLEGITRRFIFLIWSLTDEQLQITYYHPTRNTRISQIQAIHMAAWHLKHHLAHIKIAIGR
ncbi:MAG TPA: DinB family protein [Sphingobacteriaceae bacterium]